jgi:hypothetical protein
MGDQVYISTLTMQTSFLMTFLNVKTTVTLFLSNFSENISMIKKINVNYPSTIYLLKYSICHKLNKESLKSVNFSIFAQFNQMITIQSKFMMLFFKAMKKFLFKILEITSVNLMLYLSKLNKSLCKIKFSTWSL